MFARFIAAEIAGLSDSEIAAITAMFNSDPVKRLPYEQRNCNRWRRFATAIAVLGKFKEVKFDFSIEDLIQLGDTATSIDIGSWSRNLHGLCFGGYVASLEDEDDDTNNVSFKTFASLVAYVKGVIAEHAPALTK